MRRKSSQGQGAVTVPPDVMALYRAHAGRLEAEIQALQQATEEINCRDKAAGARTVSEGRNCVQYIRRKMVVPPIEYLPAEAIIENQNAAQLTQRHTSCGQRPQPVHMHGRPGPQSRRGPDTVIAIDRDTIYETQLDGNTTLDLGQTYDIGATSLLADGDRTTMTFS